MATKKSAKAKASSRSKEPVTSASVTVAEQAPEAEARQDRSTNPNDWLFVNPEGPLPNFAFGVLRRTLRDQPNTASAFAQAKLVPVAPQETAASAWVPTAYRNEVVLPLGADDAFRSAAHLFERFDATALEWHKSLVIYVTLSFPESRRMHEDFEVVRAFAKSEFVERRGLPVLLVQHAPFLAGSTNPPHVHVLALARRLTSLGFADYVDDISKDAGQRLIYGAWQEFART